MGVVNYSVHEMAELSGVSVRTLHYYDEKGLLNAQRRENNYRGYGPQEVDRLQQILFYREIGLRLDEIKQVLDSDSFVEKDALASHLENLKQQQKQINQLIKNVEKTIARLEGKATMSDKEKFEGFKKRLIEENEEKYGSEIRNKYGSDAVDASYEKVRKMNKEQYTSVQELEGEIKLKLVEALATGDPAGSEAQTVCDLHRQWISSYWKEGAYSKEAHKSLGEMYVADDRFKEYYESIALGATTFLRDALEVYCR